VSSFVIFNPEAVSAAAQDLTGIGSAIQSANAAAAASTSQVAAAAQDEVSTAIAGVFGDYAQEYQALLTQAEQFHDEFVETLTTSAEAYLATEAANVDAAVSQLEIEVKPFEVKPINTFHPGPLRNLTSFEKFILNFFK
jgi:DNA-binding SARP family transcriptional activator